MVFKAKWTNLNRYQWFRSFLQMSGEVPGQVAARSFAIFWRLAISGKARQRNSQKIELSGGFKMLFYFCTAVLRSTNSALQVCMEKNVKFKHKFCINLWFFLLKKGRCVMACLCNVCIYITLYVVVRTYGQNHLLSWSKKH